MSVGSAIKKCRKAKNLTLAKLSEKTELSTSYLSLIEQDRRTPNLNIVELIAESLEIPVSIILFLGTDQDAIEELDPELADRLTQLTFNLLLSDGAA